jgi:phage shock protein PspC (stress-responsive transcriptional regulator)
VRAQLQRSRTDKVIGGVAGGLARYSGIDALLWRVGFVALAFAGGTGVLVYLLLWLLMPVDPSDAPVARPYSAPPAPAAPRSPVPGLTVAALLIAVGVLALLTRLTDWDPGPRTFLGTALLVVGLGLVAAAFAGGRTAKGGLIALGVVLSFALALASAAPWRGGGEGVGDRSWTPTTAGAVRSSYESGVGDVLIDLSRIDVSELDRPIRTVLHSGAGEVDIVVPDDADVRVEVHSGFGDVTVLDGEVSDGEFFAGDGRSAWVDDGSAEIDLTIHSGFGDVEVSRG